MKEYRLNRRTGDKISAIGLGTSYIAELDEKTAIEAEYYQKLEFHVDSCIWCGHCESRCPFHVKQMARMKEINSFFTR